MLVVYTRFHAGQAEKRRLKKAAAAGQTNGILKQEGVAEKKQKKKKRDKARHQGWLTMSCGDMHRATRTLPA